MAKKQKKRGHFCWCCESILPNEKFSGEGHAQHLCRKCSALPKAERALPAGAHLLRLVTWEGIIGRKKRKAFAPYLEHSEPRIRKIAEELAAEDIEARRLLRRFDGSDEKDVGGTLEDPEDPSQCIVPCDYEDIPF